MEVVIMKFIKVPNTYCFSKYIREDGEYTVTTKTRNNKAAYVVTNRNGEEIAVFAKMKDAKAAYADKE
jgi:hypothetical protein